MPGNASKRARVDTTAADASNGAFDAVASAGTSGSADGVANPMVNASAEQTQMQVPSAAAMAARRQAIRARCNNSAEQFTAEREMIAALPDAAALGNWLGAVVEKHGWEQVVRLLFSRCPSERLTSLLQELCENHNPFRELDTSRAFRDGGVLIGDEAAPTAPQTGPPSAPPSAPGSLHAGRTRPLSTDVQSPAIFRFQQW